jgi:hypothetical protein
LYNRFYSEAELTKDAVLRSVEHSYQARLFILHAFSEYLRMQVPTTDFVNTNVIENEGIEFAHDHLTAKRPRSVFLVQVFSGYWCYYEGRCYPTDDIFEAIAMCLFLLEVKFDNELFGIQIGPQLEGALPRRAAGPERLQQQEVAGSRFML